MELRAVSCRLRRRSPALNVHFEDVNDWGVQGIRKLSGNINFPCCRIINSAPNLHHAAGIIKRKCKNPHRVWLYFPLLFRAVFHRQKIVGIICPHLILVRVSVSSFRAIRRIITIAPGP